MTGERLAWFELAHLQQKSFQECLASNTSTEFLEWMVFLRKKRWEETTKQEYYLAQIAAEIRVFREGLFSNKPKPVSLQDLLLKPVEDASEALRSKPARRKKPKKKQVHAGPQAMKDPHWAKVTRDAKSLWAQRLAVQSLSDLQKGS